MMVATQEVSFMTFSNEPLHNEKFDKKMDAKSGSDGPSPWLIGLIIVAILAVVFIAQNRNKVHTHFLFFEVESKVWFALFIAMALGALLDRLFTTWWRRRKAEKAEK